MYCYSPICVRKHSPFLKLSFERARELDFDTAVKTPTTIRLDADVMRAFQAAGKGWQTRINAVLREAIEAGRA